MSGFCVPRGSAGLVAPTLTLSTDAPGGGVKFRFAAAGAVFIDSWV